MILYIAIHILPVLLVFLGIIPAVYFFVKIKLISYRIVVIFNLALNFFFINLYIKDLELVFMQTGLFTKSYGIGSWELFNLLNIIRLICFDLVIYYLYTHTNIIISSSGNGFYSLVVFLARDSKIYKITLRFAIAVLILALIVFETAVNGTSEILGLVSNLLKDKL